LTLAHALENSQACAKPYLDQKKDDTDGSSFGIEAHVFDSRKSLNFGAGAGIQLTGGKLKVYILQCLFW